MTLLTGQKRNRSEVADCEPHQSSSRFRLDSEGSYIIDFHFPETIAVSSEDDVSSWSEFEGDLLETFPVVQVAKKSSVWKTLSELFLRKANEEFDFALIVRIVRQLYQPKKAEELADVILDREDLDRTQKIEELSRSSDLQLKFIFTIVQCLEYFQINPQGQTKWFYRKRHFEEEFSNTIGQFLRTNKAAQRKPWLESTLHHVHAYISYLIKEKEMPLQGNLCFFLCVASCVEGRGKYHGRTSKNLSAMLQCYRYLIETTGGISYSSIPEEARKAHEVTLINSFESF